MAPRTKRQARNKQADASPSPPDSDIEAVRERTRRAAGHAPRKPAARQPAIATAGHAAATTAREENEDESSGLSSAHEEEPMEEVKPILTRAKVPIRRAAGKAVATSSTPVQRKKRVSTAKVQENVPKKRKKLERAPSPEAVGPVLDQMAAGYDSASDSSQSESIARQVKDEVDSDEDAFEDVDLRAPKRASAKYDKDADASDEEDLDLTLAKAEKVDLSNGKPKKRSGMEQQIRARTHYLSLLCQVAHGAWTNAWCNAPELHTELRAMTRSKNARLDKLLAKTARESVVGNVASETLHATLASAAKWFHSRFKRTRPGLRKKGYRPATYFDPDGEYETYKRAVFQTADKPDWTTTGLAPEWEACETFPDKAAFIQQASTLQGSRDYGAHLFTALLRAYHFRCRHVFSTQPLGFKFNEREEWVPEVIQPNQKVTPAKRPPPQSHSTPPPKRRQVPGSGRSSDAIRLDTSSLSSAPVSDREEDDPDECEDVSTGNTIDAAYATPIFWTEVFDATAGTWFAVDAMVNVRCYVADKDLKLLQPRGKFAASQKLGMGLVVAYGAAHNAKDVTLRYTASQARLNDHVMRANGGTFTRFDANRVLVPFLRSHLADPAERAEDALLAFTEKARPKPDEMPTTLSGFQRHPRYMLEKHLREKEAFKPGAQPVGTFMVGKGAKQVEERIFLRSDTVPGKTVENYHKEGRVVKVGEQPLKMIRQRAMTTARIRELQEYEREHGEPMMQPIYAVSQTEYIVPPPIVDGVIPKNAYGNADVFVPSMVPQGAVHLPHKGLSRVAKKFSFDWAEACTGFSFSRRGAAPVIEGVLVAEEHAEELMRAFEADEAERIKKQDLIREKAALGRWKKMLAGLRIKARIQAEYGMDAAAAVVARSASAGSMSAAGKKSKGKENKVKTEAHDADKPDSRGGY